MTRQVKQIQLGVAALVCLAAPVIAVSAATRWGVGITPDSIAYIAGARSVLSGDGFAMPGAEPVPITHFPPFYSFVLAAIGAIGLDPLEVARWLGALVFAGNVGIVGWLLARLNGRRTPAVDGIALLGMAVMLASVTLLEIHTMAWSEGSFILLGMLGFVLLARWLDEDRFVFLALGALAMGMALVTRYAGVAYVGAGGLAILFLSRRRWLSRLGMAIAFGVLAALPMGLWIARNLALADNATNRELYLHVPSAALIWETVDTASAWLLLPDFLSLRVRGLSLLLIGAACALVYLLYLRPRGLQDVADDRGTYPAVLGVLLLFVPVYLATLVLNNAVLRVYTPMEPRILSPLFPPLVVLTLFTVRSGLRHAPAGRIVRPLLSALAGVFVSVSLFEAVRYVERGYLDGLGFNNRLWRESATLQQLPAVPATRTLYSNAPEAIYLYLERPAEKLPRAVEVGTLLPNPNFSAASEKMRHEIDTEGALVVLFDIAGRRSAADDRLIERLGVRMVTETRDGKIYAAHDIAGTARKSAHGNTNF